MPTPSTWAKKADSAVRPIDYTVYVHRVHTHVLAVQAGLPTTDTKSQLSWTPPIIHLSLMSTLSRSPTSLGDGMTKVSLLFAFTLRLSIGKEMLYIVHCMSWWELLLVVLEPIQFNSELSASHIPHREIHLPQAYTLVRKSHVLVNTCLLPVVAFQNHLENPLFSSNCLVPRFAVSVSPVIRLAWGVPRFRFGPSFQLCSRWPRPR